MFNSVVNIVKKFFSKPEVTVTEAPVEVKPVETKELVEAVDPSVTNEIVEVELTAEAPTAKAKRSPKKVTKKTK